MTNRIIKPAAGKLELSAEENRRRIARIPAAFGLMYSGMKSGQMLIADGLVMNLSESGVGVLGKRLVNPGMELALFIDFPGEEDPVCISEGQVSWVAGRRFGVRLVIVQMEAQMLLQSFLRSHLDH